MSFTDTDEAFRAKVNIRLYVDRHKSIRAAMNELEYVLSEEFGVGEGGVKVREMKISKRLPDSFTVLIKSLQSINLQEVERRAEDALVRELSYDRDSTSASVIDTVP